MSDYKYTKTGQKVLVIEVLNDKESIVKEVYVKENGEEVAVGDKFVTNMLLDEPAQSWHSKNEQKELERLERAKLNREKIELECNKKAQKLLALSKVVKSTLEMCDNMNGVNLDQLTAVLSGTVKYIVVDGYTYEPPQEFITAITQWEDRYCGDGFRRFEDIKLLSAMGNSKGNLTYNLNRYRDGSGYSTEIHPFTSYEEALDHIKKRAEKDIGQNKLRHRDYKTCLDMGIVFDEDFHSKYRIKRNKEISEHIRKHEEEIKKHQEKIQELVKDYF